MSDIVERVADGLIADFKAQIEESAGKPFVETGVALPHRSIWLRKARAAIEAMRESTEAMESAGALVFDDDLCDATNAMNMWQAMCDEALR